MITNTSMTLYHRTLDKDTRAYRYTRSVIDKVMWQGSKVAKQVQGIDDNDQFTIYIPKIENIEISVDDIVVKGIIDTEIITQQDLKVEEVYNVTAITNYDYGSENMRHIKLIVK